MKIAILGAMVEEIEPLLEFFKEYEEIKYAQNRYYEVRYKNLDLIIAYSKIGKVNATLTAATVIEKFGAEMILFSGVAGAISSELKIGDLIVASALCQHDVDITAFGHPFGFVPEGKVNIECDKDLVKLAHRVAKEKEIDLKEGVVATGDQFVADSAKKEWIGKTFKADALEMEGAAVAAVADTFDIPCFVLRAISDAADMDATFNFDDFLFHSAKTSADFIIGMIDKIVRGEEGVGSRE